MNNKDSSDNNLKDTQASAAIVAITIITFSVIYWGVQIQGAREMLALAYG